jgi:rubrerythrin
MNTITALENLIKSLDDYRDVDDVCEAIEIAIKVLGYDPSYPIRDYIVTLVLEVGAKDTSDTIKQAVKLIDDNQAVNWSYIVKDENGKKAEIGGWEVF